MMHKLVRVRQSTLLLLSLLLTACLALGLCFIVPVSANADGEPAFTYFIGDTSIEVGAGNPDDAVSTDADGIHYYSLDKGWTAAVAKAVELKAEGAANSLVLVKLSSDWTAFNGNAYGMGDAYENGALLVPENVDMAIDMCGNMLNRNLTSAVENGGNIVTYGNLRIYNSSTAKVKRLFTNASSEKYTYGALLNESDDTVVSVDCTGALVTGGYSMDNGGGVYVAGGSLTVENVLIAGNASISGGGVYVEKGESTFNGAQIAYNNANNGGGLYLEGDTLLTLNGTSVSYNKATLNGGALQAMSGSLVNVSDSYVMYNSASTRGGIYAGTIVIDETIISNNSASGMHGGIYASKLTLKNSIVSENDAGTDGGGIYTTDETVIDGSSVTGNLAGTNGGGIYGQGSLTIKNRSTIAENVAGIYGGGLYLVNGKSNISGSTIELNEAESGGGIYHLSDVSLKDVTLRGNTAELSGGGVYNASSALTVKGSSVITANKAEQDGGGVYVANTISLSGAVKITDNKLGGRIVNNTGSLTVENGVVNNVYLTAANKIIPYTEDGVLTAAAQIGVTPSDLSSLEITEGFGTKYITNEKVSNPADWFVCDPFDEYSYLTVLDGDGEARFIRSETTGANWTYTFDGSPENEITADGYSLTFGYGEKILSTLKLNGEDMLGGSFLYQVKRDAGEVVAHVITGTLAFGDDVTDVSFYVYITPKTLEDSNVSIDTEANLTFDGTAKTPVLATDGSNQLIAGIDYTVNYSDNVNAGTCTAVVTGAGNYVGSVTKTFTIVKDESLSYTVGWEYYNGSEWSAVDANASFTYAGTSYDGNVRAVLGFSGREYAEYVYAKDCAEDTVNANKNLYLEFAGTFEESGVTTLVNATTYTVTIGGSGNAVIPDNTKTTIKITPATLGISESDFANYEDAANGNRLWLLSFNGTTATLRGAGTTYYDPDAENQVTVGNLNDAYARYNGSPLTVTLNGEYRVGGHDLAFYLKTADVRYTSNTATGAKSAITEVTTSVTLAFNANFSSQTITLNKTWYVVNINNALRGALSHNEATIPDWTFGSKSDVDVLRPEHGDYAIYSVAPAGGQSSETFAVCFDGSNVSYYNVKTESGVNVPDTTKPYGKTFNSYLDTLGAGSYILSVYVPEYQVTSHHTHWWDGTASNADDESTIYHSITATFAFSVTAYSIVNLSTDGNLSFTLSSYTVAYNGSIYNAPESSLTLNGKTLELGVDYELRLAAAGVGTTRLTVVGKGGLTGEYLYPGDITVTKATNSWAETPNVIRWAYGMYEASFNGIYATPAFMDEGANVVFSIAYDEEGKDLVVGLEAFTTDDGLVDDAVAEILAELPAGTYYLLSKVEETANYFELAQSPMEFRVSMATNTWAVTPNVIQWQYMGYTKETNLLLAQPKLVSDDMVLTFKVTSDAAGETPVAGLESFSAKDGVVTSEIAAILNNLTAGTYYLTAEVTGNANFTGINSTVSFDVARATNVWTTSPTVQTWVTGEYNENDNKIAAEALFGTVQYVVYLAGDEENVVYDTAKGINKLKDAKVGTYVLSAYVSDGSANYTDLPSSMVTFEIFAPEGLPWWVTLIIVVVVLGVAALVLYILHDKGILQMLTGKVIIAMRTRATIDATIAAVRANKVAEQARISIAEAEARDAEEARKQAEGGEAPQETKSEPQKTKEKDVTSKAETPDNEQKK